MARDASLEAAIEVAPDNVDAYLVYADWLQAQGDPRGELIVLQHANQTAEADALLAANAEYFWGKLADARDLLVPYEGEPLGAPTTWRWGYLHTVWISNKPDRDPRYFDEDEPTSLPAIDVAGAVAWLLDHPSARFLRELTVGVIARDTHYGRVANIIGERSLPTLRKLILGDYTPYEAEIRSSRTGNVEPLYAAVPNLESLTLRSGTLLLGKIALPKLRELIVITEELDSTSLAGICAANWPVLETLRLELGNAPRSRWDGPFEPSTLALAELQPIFDGTAFPRLKHLGLRSSSIADDICAALATSQIAVQLESIDLSNGKMGDVGAAALAAGRFPKLVSLEVPQKYLTKRGFAALDGMTRIDEQLARYAGYQTSAGRDTR